MPITTTGTVTIRIGDQTFEAKDGVEMRIGPPVVELPRYNRTLTAYHEAGHVVMARQVGLRINYATIDPDGDAHGHVDVEGLATDDDFALFAIAGMAAEHQVCQREDVNLDPSAMTMSFRTEDIVAEMATAKASSDHGTLFTILVSRWRSRRGRRAHNRMPPRDWCERGIDAIARKASAVLVKRWSEVQAVANELLEKGTIRYG